MLEFNNGVNKVKLNSFEATKKAKKEENKPQEKTAEASSAEALNSYGRAFVNLSFKGKVENSQAETLSKEEQEALLKEIREFYQSINFSDSDIDSLIEDLISVDKDIRNKQFYTYKKLKEDGVQTMEALGLVSLYQTDKDNAEAKIDFAKQLEKQGYNLLSIAALLYVDSSKNSSKTENLDKELALVKKLLDDSSFEDEEKSVILSQARQYETYDDSIVELAKEVKNSIPDSELYFYRLLKNLCSSNKQIQEKQLAFAKELAQNKSYSGLDISLLLDTKTDDEQTNLNRTMKARAEGEVAANPLGDLSPFSPPCVDFHFTPSLCRLHFRSSRERLCFLLRSDCGSIPSLKTVECCKTIFVPPLTSFQCSACRLLLFYIAFS